MSAADDLKKVLTIEEAAEMFGISVWTLQWNVNRGRLLARKAGTDKRAPYITTTTAVAEWFRNYRPRLRKEAKGLGGDSASDQ